LNNIELTVPVVFGLEAITANEIRGLGYETSLVEDGRVSFKCDLQGICRANINLRTGERVLLKIGEFRAVTFDELFEGTKALAWEQWISKDGQFPVKGHSIKSALFSIPDCQSIIKRAIVERLKTVYKTDWFEETGAKYQVQFAIRKDVVVMYIDTSGESLHKRGYRESGAIAPLRETLAAAMVNLSRWRGDRPFLDPMCGSGTIAIEAAMVAAGIAPGSRRHFSCEKWQQMPAELFKQERLCAKDGEKKQISTVIMASDISSASVEMAMENAKNARVAEFIEFKCSPMENLTPFTEKGAIICNPPYGERLLDVKTCERLYSLMGRKFAQYENAGKYIITSYEKFEALFGKNADKKRKIYNGMIKCNLYQYYK